MFCIILVIAFNAMGQNKADIEQNLKKINSANWEERADAAFWLAALPPELKTKQVKKALINELDKEFTRVSKESVESGESEYYSYLFDVVAEMKDDMAFPVFVKIGSPTALVKYGDKGIAIILNKLDYNSCTELSAPINTLCKVLNHQNNDIKITPETKEKVKRAIIKALNESKQPKENIEWFEIRASECAFIRQVAVRALGYLANEGERDLIPIIEDLAKNDPYYLDFSKKKNYQGERKKYLVREEAQKALEKLRRK
jgi:hypothetical protein